MKELHRFAKRGALLLLLLLLCVCVCVCVCVCDLLGTLAVCCSLCTALHCTSLYRTFTALACALACTLLFALHCIALPRTYPSTLAIDTLHRSVTALCYPVLLYIRCRVRCLVQLRYAMPCYAMLCHAIRCPMRPHSISRRRRLLLLLLHATDYLPTTLAHVQHSPCKLHTTEHCTHSTRY
jgi:hypothetical protein